MLTDLQHESSETPRIVMHDDPASVADHLRSAPEGEQRGEGPLPPAIALVEVDEQADAEDGDEEGVGGQAGLVVEDGLVDGAGVPVAEVPDALFGIGGRHCLGSWLGVSM